MHGISRLHVLPTPSTFLERGSNNSLKHHMNFLERPKPKKHFEINKSQDIVNYNIEGHFIERRCH